MVILILGGGIFLGFGLGFATMALLDARHHRLQCEKERETYGYSPRRQGLPGVSGQAAGLRRLKPTFYRVLKRFETQTG